MGSGYLYQLDAWTWKLCEEGGKNIGEERDICKCGENMCKSGLSMGKETGGHKSRSDTVSTFAKNTDYEEQRGRGRMESKNGQHICKGSGGEQEEGGLCMFVRNGE